MPKRIQRRRTKGWKMPEGAVCVTRPGPWGNPFKIGRWYAKGDVFINEIPPRPHQGFIYGEIQIGNRKHRRVYTCSETEPRSKRFHLIRDAAEAVKWYRWYLSVISAKNIIQQELRGKELACFCPLDQPCHADVLLEIANA